MGQEEILDILRQNKDKKYTVTELAELLNKGVSATSVNLRKMVNWKVINSEELKITKESRVKYLFWYKENDNNRKR
jgi:predicted transcriptional regulator